MSDLLTPDEEAQARIDLGAGLIALHEQVETLDHSGLTSAELRTRLGAAREQAKQIRALRTKLARHDLEAEHGTPALVPRPGSALEIGLLSVSCPQCGAAKGDLCTETRPTFPPHTVPFHGARAETMKRHETVSVTIKAKG